MAKAEEKETLTMEIFVSLVHHPVVDRNGELITASVTNLDLHDIARSCRTFGVKRYFVVHPSPDEQALNSRILHHWELGYGKRAHPTRSEAVQIVELMNDFPSVQKRIREITGELPVCVGTSAKAQPQKSLEIFDLERRAEGRPILLVFGTAYGLAPSLSSQLDFFLPPIQGPNQDYNHLSVRSAVAIYLDRLGRG